MNWADYSRWTPRTRRTTETTDLTAAAVGAGLLAAGAMYLFDPVAGARRRSVIRGKMTRALNNMCSGVDKTFQYAAGQFQGMFYEARNLFRADQASDETLVARVRAAMGRVVSHPKAIDVMAHEGVVILSGQVLADELPGLLQAVNGVRGVERVEDVLQVHTSAENIPDFQGQRRRRGWRFALMQENWSPTMRAGAVIAGSALGAWAAQRRDLLGIPLGVVGLALVLRGATNTPAKRMVGLGAGRRAVDVQKTITIKAPLEGVFCFFSNYENFPYFMSNIVEVRDAGNGRSYWAVKGPAGVVVRWDAQLTRFVPNELIAWKSVAGSTVANAGMIQFQPTDEGSTRVDIKLSYNPPGGAIGHAIAKVFGADPKSEMDQDLLRAKTLLETGQPAHDAAKA